MPYRKPNTRVDLGIVNEATGKPYWVEVRRLGYIDEQNMAMILAGSTKVSFQTSGADAEVASTTMADLGFGTMFAYALRESIVAWDLDDDDGVIPLGRDTAAQVLERDDQLRVLAVALKGTDKYGIIENDLKSLSVDAAAPTSPGEATPPGLDMGYQQLVPNAGSVEFHPVSHEQAFTRPQSTTSEVELRVIDGR